MAIGNFRINPVATGTKKVKKNPCEGCMHYDKDYDCAMKDDRSCYEKETK